jgi:arsenate reductase
MLTIYGIPNCDTCRKARKWLADHGVDYRFHDLRADGLTISKVRHWVDSVGWEALLNRRSATWRQLPEGDRDKLTADKAVTLLVAHPTLVKRPVAETAGTVMVGFAADEYDKLR